jgi:hypothetical protein
MLIEQLNVRVNCRYMSDRIGIVLAQLRGGCTSVHICLAHDTIKQQNPPMDVVG